jgi:Rrf2 family transcriptional regulator, iron-sulfur cluster assembly transcription factor
MLFSKGCTYGIRASILITLKEKHEDRKFIPLQELAEELGLSFHFLTKIMQILTEAGIMESFRGPNGGVGLARNADQINLIEIVAAIDGMGMFEQCVLGLPGCSDETPCPLHKGWGKRRESYKKVLRKTTLASLARDIQKNTQMK